jgi:hypothetical protein
MYRGCLTALVVYALAGGPASAEHAAVARAPVAAQPSATVGSAAAQVQGTSELPNIDSCVGRLDPELDIGYDRIATRCPDLVKQLDHGAWAPWLPRGWKEPGNDLSAGSLKEFRELVSREDVATISARTPDVRHLQSVLSGLAAKQTEGWWSKFKSWLRSVLETREQVPDESWFSRMVAHVGLSQSLRQLVAYAALAAVVVLAGLIVVNELRTAGLLPRRLGGRRRAVAPVQSRVPQQSWSDIDQLPLLDRPRSLLELIVRRLGERGALPPAGALTVRELTRLAQLSEPEDRTRLVELGAAAERVRYSAREIEPTALEQSVARGRELLDRLDVSAAR